MSFRTNDPNADEQLTLFGGLTELTEREKKHLKKSWAESFRNDIYPAINEERFAVLYSNNPATRPNTPINFILGAMIIGTIQGLSEEELIESILFDIRYQYALHTINSQEQPVNEHSFRRFRQRVLRYKEETGIDLIDEEFKHLTTVMGKFMRLNPEIKRMDSMMVASHCKSMSRLELIYQVNANAIHLLHKNGRDDLIPSELKHYLESDDLNKVIYYSKSDELSSRLIKVISELELLLNAMEEKEWAGFSEYQMLCRVKEEQCSQNENGKTMPKENKEISTNSLQNPSDPDATFRRKAGKSHKGYVANITETIGENGDSLITGISVEQNTHSDIEFCREYLESRPENAEHETLITDGAYGSEENFKLAEKKNVELVATALTGVLPDQIYADFKMNEEGNCIIKCPAGHAPIHQNYNNKTEMCRAVMAAECCANCPYHDKCHPKKQKNSFVVNVSKKKIHRAKYMQKISTEEYIKISRLRNAVEGIPSVLRRKFRIDEIPVFGLMRTTFYIQIKVIAYNFGKFFKSCRRAQLSCTPTQIAG